MNDLLMKIGILYDLTEKQLSTIRSYAVYKQYKRGMVLIKEGDSANGLFIVKSGYLKVLQYSENGREKILALLGAGDIFGEMGAFGQKLRSASVIALEQSEVILIPQCRFEEILTTIPAIGLNITEIVTERLKQANKQLVQVAGCSSRDKVIGQLLTLAEAHGMKQNNCIIIRPRLTHSDIASLSGVVRETVTKVLSDLKKEGLVNSEGRRIIIMNRQRM